MRASVLITCYRRRQYLDLSVTSALADGADQVVVVKDWSDPIADRAFTDRGVALVTEDIPVIGEALARGLARCDGDTVSFLDDDDLLVRGRLAAVRAAFEPTPSLVLFRNGYTEIDVNGAPYVPKAGPLPQPRAPYSFSSDSIDDSVLRWIVDRRAYGILSTITVRREALLPWVADLSKVECGIDIAVPTLLMRDRYRHAFSPDPLTIHRAGSSLRAGTTSDDPAAYARTFRRLQRAAGSEAARRYASMNARWAELARLVGPRRLERIQRLRARSASPSLRDLAGVLLPSVMEIS
jgi:glycosyltransferase involved in cell wall biosynthesis